MQVSRAFGRAAGVPMKPHDGFGLHIDFAHRVLSQSVYLSPSGLEEHQIGLAMPEELRHAEAELTQLGSGVSYLNWSCSDARDETTIRAGHGADYLTFPFHLLPGPIEVGIEGVKRPILLSRSDSYILGPTVMGTQTVRPGVPTSQLCLFLDMGTIESCFEDRQQALPAVLKRAFTHAESEPFYLPGRTTTAMGLAVRQMLTCGLRGGLARLYLEAKILEIAALRLAQLTDEGHRGRRHKLMRSDIDRLEEARAVLLERYADPPTITELSQAVGVNRTKLKAGFKDRFGSTIFGFIRAQRMEHALLLLSDGECNVGEAAVTVGYNSVSAFAAAFRVAFGFSPRVVRGCKDVTELDGPSAS